MLTQRGGQGSRVTEVKAKKAKEEKLTAKKTGHDPLKWFGFLVPTTLRQSQDCFKRAVEMTVEVANIQNEIEGVLAREKFLKRTKTKLEKD